jgi:hypothetical protein
MIQIENENSKHLLHKKRGRKQPLKKINYLRRPFAGAAGKSITVRNPI